eukprot:3877297-Pyramimonas_sp.AAC.1
MSREPAASNRWRKGEFVIVAPGLGLPRGAVAIAADLPSFPEYLLTFARACPLHFEAFPFPEESAATCRPRGPGEARANS